MKKITLFIAFIFTAFNFFGQAGWTNVESGLAAGKGIGQISVGMNDNTAMWAVAVNADGSIYDAFTRSIDGGNTWEAGSFNAGSGLSQLFAFDSDVCWAVFNTGATQGLYKTEDGGLTWVKKGGVYGASSFANVLHFFDDMNGYAQGDPIDGYYEIYTTTDGGETWTRTLEANIPAPLSGEYGITGNYCAFEGDTWFGTNMGRIFKSTDMGYTWTPATTTLMDGANPATVSSVMFDDMNGLAYPSFLNVGMAEMFNVTTDGGATWVDMFPAGQNYARYIALVPGTESTIIGSAGSASDAGMGISISYDGGVNWEIITQDYSFLASAWLDLETGWCGTDASATGGMYIYGNPPAPTNLDATVDVLEVTLTWSGPVASSFSDDFESHEDFVLDFAPWTNIDVDGSDTYGMENIDWINEYAPQAFIIFNPYMTTPATEDIIPHSGDKLAACFASVTPDNDDWLISPQVMVESGAQVSFWAKSYTDEYGLERFNVGISTTDMEPGSFTIISESPYTEAPVEDWTQYTYDLSGYEGEVIYVGIQCVSSDAFILLVDDFSVGTTTASFAVNNNTAIVGSANRDMSFTEVHNALETKSTSRVRSATSLELLGFNVYRDGSKINTGIVEAEEYVDTDVPIGVVEYYVTAVYTGGESDPSNMITILITNIIDNKENLIKIYPNPAYDVLNIEAPNDVKMIRIMNIVGQTVYSIAAQNSNSTINVSELDAGVYFVQIETELGTSTQKIVIE